MDAPAPSSIPARATSAPIYIGAVGLAVRDLHRLTAYYRDLLGLVVQTQTARSATLGIGGIPLIELIHQPEALPDDPREAGLYHTAFLMPTRADLARWILHVAKSRIPITGASDHDVSEAIYLDDPEGNGIEVYSDRPSETWRRNGTEIFQKTDPLDIEAIVREVDPAMAIYHGAPAGLRIGHLHLRVGDVAEAETFYGSVLGLDVTRRRTGATFMSSGGYHHHVGANVWHSNGAGFRSGKHTGLAWFDMRINDRQAMHALKTRLATAGKNVEDSPGGFVTTDPWGTEVRFGPAS